MYIFEKIDDEHREFKSYKTEAEYSKVFEEEWKKKFGNSDEERIMSAEDTLQELKRMAQFNVGYQDNN